MVINTIKNRLLSSDSKYPREFQKILNQFSKDFVLDIEDEQKLFNAYKIGLKAHEGQKRQSGSKYFDHCIEVCIQLIAWNMDLNTIIAGLLHDTIEDTELSIKELEKNFGHDITKLVNGVSKLSGIKFRDSKHKQAENFMKMFLSLSQDLRVIIIKFSDRLHNMRTLKYLPESKQERIALETRELYAPLAHRLGMNNIKIQFEDLTFKILDKKNFNSIKRKVRESYAERKVGCPFCEIPKKRILEEDELCYVIRDGFPVTDLHTLVIPKRHVETYFDLYQSELNSCNRMIQKFKERIEKEEESVEGFNIGINNGEVSGQTVFHCHIHLIPRREVDVENPKGGVRGVIPNMQKYGKDAVRMWEGGNFY